MSDREKTKLASFSAIELSFDENGVGAKSIRKFMRHCANSGANVLVTFPTTIRFEDYKSEGFTAQIEKIETFVNTNGGRILGKPDDFMHTVDYFFNSNYHANEDGRSRTTDRLGDLLAQFRDEQGS